MVLHTIPQPLPVHFFGSRPQPPTSPHGMRMLSLFSYISGVGSFVQLHNRRRCSLLTCQVQVQYVNDHVCLVQVHSGYSFCAVFQKICGFSSFTYVVTPRSPCQMWVQLVQFHIRCGFSFGICWCGFIVCGGSVYRELNVFVPQFITSETRLVPSPIRPQSSCIAIEQFAWI